MRFLVLLVCLLSASAAHAGNVTITVTGTPNATGNVKVALCTQAEFLKMQCALHQAQPASTEPLTFLFVNVPAGAYAAQAFHDANDNGEIDRNWFGLPQEALGFSRITRMSGKPKFAEAAYEFGDGPAAFIVELQRYD